MNEIIALVDYKGNFGSKYDAVPYRSGFDKVLLSNLFREIGYQLRFVPITYANNLESVKGRVFLYQSSEDTGYHYKSYIEDIVFYLEQRGAILLPEYKYLRANNNKVFMELIRKEVGNQWGDTLKSWVFGCLEEMEQVIQEFEFPVVFKTAEGAMSRGVLLAKDKDELRRIVKKRCRSVHINEDIKDFLRPYKHNNYIKESLYRNKFIVQQFIPNLYFDYKVLIFGDNYFVFRRNNRKNDFRASGSGNLNYKYGTEAEAPKELFVFSEKIVKALNVPNLSIDLGIAYNKCYMLEFQAVYFGPVGVYRSKDYMKYIAGDWVIQPNNITLEEYYVYSIVTFLRKK